MSDPQYDDDPHPVIGSAEQDADACDGASIDMADPRCNQNEEDDDEADDESDEENSGPKSLREELNVEDLSRCLFFKDSKLFAAAGPGMPLLQVNVDGTFVSLNPDSPYRPEVDEDVVISMDAQGRLLDPLGEVRKLTGMKYKGQALYYVNERHPENKQHLAAWFDSEGKAHFLYLGDTILSAAMILKIRNRTIDGELSKFDEIRSE